MGSGRRGDGSTGLNINEKKRVCKGGGGVLLWIMLPEIAEE